MVVIHVPMEEGIMMNDFHGPNVDITLLGTCTILIEFCELQQRCAEFRAGTAATRLPEKRSALVLVRCSERGIADVTSLPLSNRFRAASSSIIR
jgi:hypothetical protein